MFAALLGMSLVGLVLYDIYQTIVIPRFKPSTFRLAPFIVGRLLWPGFKKVAVGQSCPLKDVMLGSFATFGFVTLFIIWMALLVAGFGLIFWGQGTYVTPAITDYWTALYVAGSAILTLGSGDAVAVTGPARFTAMASAFTGIVFMAIAVSFIFTMQNAVQKREITVNTLDSRLGSSTTGLGLLLRYRELGLQGKLGQSFNQWELWVAELLESHRAFPLLSYFRSAKSCVSWVTILGALLDASALTMASVSGEATGEARLFFELAAKTVQSLASFLNLEVEEETMVSQEEYNEMLNILATAGYHTRGVKDSYLHFSSLRLQYASHVKALSSHLVSMAPSLLGDLTASGEDAKGKEVSPQIGSKITQLRNARNASRHLRLVR
ncbi:MAG: hypothetical protein KGS72_07845 [Cyanobacteria bacterium REEB67]|nr:hypothetical protein [Cyanobacteria bacterium REEB67]